MRALLVTNMFPDEKSPHYGIFVKKIADALSVEEGMTLHVSAIRGRSRHLADKVVKYMFFFAGTAAKCLMNGYDLVYVHYPPHSYLPVLLAGFFRKQAVALHVHGGDVARLEGFNRYYFGLKRLVSARAINDAVLVIAPSEHYKNYIMEEYGAQEEKILVSHSGGVDLKVFRPEEKKRQTGGFTLGYAGRIDKGKGLDTLIGALSILKGRIEGLECVVVGDGQMAGEAAVMAKKTGVQGIVTFKGAVKQDALREHLVGMDLFVFPSRGESLGLAGIEAMACGVPVVGSDLGGLKEYLVDGFNGFAFDPGDEADLSEKIMMFYRLGRDERDRMSENARKTAARFDSDMENARLIKRLRGF